MRESVSGTGSRNTENDQYLPDLDLAFEIGGGYDYYGFPQFPAGDIQEDPQIPNVQWGDWHIAPTSPCRAAGATGAVVTEWDIDGNPREIDSCADIGAEESGGTNPTVGPPITIYVDTAGCDSSAGTSWASAVATVQRGVDLAWNAGGGEVWIAGGTYAILWPVELGPFISLYGGFAGNESSLSQRNWQANQTILDGCYLTWPILYAKVGGSVVLDGFTVTDAAAGGFSMAFSFTAATIANASISNNLSSGIVCSCCSLVTIEDNAIAQNSAPTVDSGGGIYCYGALYGIGETVNISHNTISGNSGGAAGGGIYCQGLTANVDSNLIEYNFCAPADSASGTYGGGLAIWETFDSSVTNNIFAYNSTNASAEQPITQGQGGGGIYANGNVGLCIANNTFAYNGTGSGPLDYADFQSVGYGGAVLIDLPPYWMEFGEYDEPTLIVNNIFYENFAEGGEAVTFNNEAQGMIWYFGVSGFEERARRDDEDAHSPSAPEIPKRGEVMRREHHAGPRL